MTEKAVKKQEKYKLTPEHEAQMKPWGEKWVENGLSTRPMDEVDRAAMKIAVKGLYESVDVKAPAPDMILFARSPLMAQVITGIGCALAYQFENKELNRQIFPASLTTEEDVIRHGFDLILNKVGHELSDFKPEVFTKSAPDYSDWCVNPYSKVAIRKICDVLGLGDTGIECIKACRSMMDYGNQNTYSAFPSFFRTVVKLEGVDFSKWIHYENAAIHGGPRFMDKSFTVISDRPTEIHMDDRKRAHNDKGPFARWSDGFAVYEVHGLKVNAWIIETPEKIDVASIDKESNSEIRRIMLEKYGVERYVRDSNAKVVDTCPADHRIVGLQEARLYRKDVPNDEPIIMLDVRDSTKMPNGVYKRYMIRVDPQAYNGEAAKNCLAAVASTWRNKVDNSFFFPDYRDYDPAMET